MKSVILKLLFLGICRWNIEKQTKNKAPPKDGGFLFSCKARYAVVKYTQGDVIGVYNNAEIGVNNTKVLIWHMLIRG